MVNRLLRVLMSTSLLGAVAACSTGADAPTLGATPEGLPAGTPLVYTLRTPQGTLLLGQVFPHESGATALMLVTGDPLAAWSDLVDQAFRAGFGLTAGSSEACWLSTARTRWWDREDEVPLSAGHPPGLSGLGCDAYGDAPAGTDGQRRNLAMRMRVGSTPDPYLAHLLVQYRINNDTSTTPEAGPSAQVSAPQASSPVLPTPFTQLPAVGAPLGLPFFDGEGYRVAEGSQLLAPSFPGTCTAGGFVVVVRATESTSTVVDRYAEQFRQAGLRNEDRKQIDAGPTTASTMSLSTAGGGHGMITAVTAADGATYLLLERCND